MQPTATERDRPTRSGEPTHPHAIAGLAHSLRLAAQGRHPEAAHLLGHAYVKNPESLVLRETLALAQFRAGHLVGARCTFAAMVIVAPRDAFARYGLGLTHARLGDLAEARHELGMATRLRPAESRYRRAAELLGGVPGRDEIERLELGERPMPSRRADR